MVSDNAVRRQAQSTIDPSSAPPKAAPPPSVPPSVLLFPAGSSAADLGFDFSKLVSPIPASSRSRPHFDPSRPFSLVELMSTAGRDYKADSTNGSRLTLKVFPGACWNTLNTLQRRVANGIGKDAMVSACIEYGVEHLQSSEMVREYITLRGRNSEARKDLDSAVIDQITAFLEGFAPTCTLRRKPRGIGPWVPYTIGNKLSVFSEATGIEKAPLAVWCITEALVIQPSEFDDGAVGVNDGYRKQMQTYLEQVAHDLEIATRWARAGMDEFAV